MDQPTWEQLALSLATRLPRLRVDDTIILMSDGRYVQLGQGPVRLHVEAAAGESLPDDARLPAEQYRRLGELGWRPPESPGESNWFVDEQWPLSGRTAAEVATRMVSTLRDVYGLDVDRIEQTAFNATG